MNQTTFVNPLSSDQLFAQIFGPDEAASPTAKTEGEFKPASFSAIMQLAHNINRRHGHMYTKGCKCRQCEINHNMVKHHV